MFSDGSPEESLAPAVMASEQGDDDVTGGWGQNGTISFLCSGVRKPEGPQGMRHINLFAWWAVWLYSNQYAHNYESKL